MATVEIVPGAAGEFETVTSMFKPTIPPSSTLHWVRRKWKIILQGLKIAPAEWGPIAVEPYYVIAEFELPRASPRFFSTPPTTRSFFISRSVFALLLLLDALPRAIDLIQASKPKGNAELVPTPLTRLLRLFTSPSGRQWVLAPTTALIVLNLRPGKLLPGSPAFRAFYTMAGPQDTPNREGGRGNEYAGQQGACTAHPPYSYISLIHPDALGAGSVSLLIPALAQGAVCAELANGDDITVAVTTVHATAVRRGEQTDAPVESNPVRGLAVPGHLYHRIPWIRLHLLAIHHSHFILTRLYRNIWNIFVPETPNAL
ncbi:hypothetical protein B0H16DRAFT_1477731 [Mycena metata]|uniref:Uncharacterized protein n=1 Tax=Mycena metata TaxID=1033252 RepID=A0AAD7MFL6_9AGAR|nr:hypothetical protein B0H16DRAFT_1477731 [Mycena metata]